MKTIELIGRQIKYIISTQEKNKNNMHLLSKHESHTLPTDFYTMRHCMLYEYNLKIDIILSKLGTAI